MIESDPNYRDPDEALRELLEHQHLILEMQATRGWELWRDYVAAIAGPYQARLLHGRHKDLLDYKFDAGIVEGIRQAIDASGSLAREISGQRLRLNESALSDQDMALANMEDGFA